MPSSSARPPIGARIFGALSALAAWQDGAPADAPRPHAAPEAPPADPAPSAWPDGERDAGRIAAGAEGDLGEAVRIAVRPLARGRVEETQRNLMALVRRLGRRADLCAVLGRFHLATGTPAEARAWFAEALRGGFRSPEVEALHAAARLAAARRGGEATRALVGALAEAEAAVAAGDESHCMRAADLAARLGDNAAAARWLERFRLWSLGAPPQVRHEAALRIAEVNWRLGRFPEALAGYLEAEAHLPRPHPRPKENRAA